MSREIARARLIDLVREHGLSLAPDLDDAMALLRREIGSYRRECAVLIDALRDRVPEAIATAPSGVPMSSLVARLANRLQQDRGLGADSAWWAVESWAAAVRATPEMQDRALDPPSYEFAAPLPERPQPEPERRPRPVDDVPPGPPPAPRVDPRVAERRAVAPESIVDPRVVPLLGTDAATTERQLRLVWVTTYVWGGAGVMWSIFLYFTGFWNGGVTFLGVLYAVVASGALAYGVQRRSRVAAVMLVTITGLNTLGAFATNWLLILINIVFLVIFIVGAQAIFRYRAAYEARASREANRPEVNS